MIQLLHDKRTPNKPTTKILILQIGETPQFFLILILVLYESSALALVPENRPANSEMLSTGLCRALL